MRSFVITIPVQENFQFFIRQLGYELLTGNDEITEAILSGELPDLRMGDECDEYPYSLELTADKPVGGQRVGERIDIPQLEMMG